MVEVVTSAGDEYAEILGRSGLFQHFTDAVEDRLASSGKSRQCVELVNHQDGLLTGCRTSQDAGRWTAESDTWLDAQTLGSPCVIRVV